MRTVEDMLGLSGSIDNRTIPTVSAPTKAADDSPQRPIEEIAAEMNAEPAIEPKITIIDEVIQPLPGLTEISDNIKDPDDDKH